MGLWLGVGVVQLLETLLTVTLPTGGPRRKVKKLATSSVSVEAIKCQDCHKLVHPVPLTSHPPENLHQRNGEQRNQMAENGKLMIGNQHDRHSEHFI